MKVNDIPNLIDIEKIKQQIINTSIVAWDHHITYSSLNRWLENFSGRVLGDKKAEQTIAAWLLYNFTFYSQSEVNELCRVLYRKFIHEKLNQEPYKSLRIPTPEKIRQVLRRTVFIPLGNPSESGHLVLYFFRTANKLSKDIFKNASDWNNNPIDGQIDDVALIDDVTLSGSQAAEYIKQINNLEWNKTRVTLLTFFAAPDAIRQLSVKVPYCQIKSANCLDKRTKLFDESSFAFSNKDSLEIKEYAYQLCVQYGDYLVNNEMDDSQEYMKPYPLGFAHGQQMFGFFYNTPDNTLPIFWCDSPNWVAAFQRHPKVYNLEGVEISDEKYW